MTDIATDFSSADGFRLGNVIDRSLAICGRRFMPLLVVMLIAQIPEWIVVTAMPDRAHEAAFGITSFALLRALLAILVGIVANMLVSGIVMHGVIQELGGREFSMRHAVGALMGRFLPMLGIALSVGIPSTLGSFLLLVPGLVWACLYFLAVPACMVERTGVLTSMSRSRSLTKGYRWRVFGMITLFTIVSLIFTAGAAVTFRNAAPTADFAIAAVLGIFYNVFNGVFYHQLRVAREGANSTKIASVFD